MHDSTDTANMELGLEGLSKIEGHADLSLKVSNGKVEYAKLIINENKRFYTQAVRGKPMQGVAQLVSRICGTCSIAHLMACTLAVESAVGIEPSEQTQKLRRLTMWSLMMRDHMMHIGLFCLPDLFGKNSVLDFDDEAGKMLVASALEVKAAGNELGRYVAGRSVHAPWPVLGGFSNFLDPSKKRDMIRQLEHAREHALEFVELFSNQPWSMEADTTFVSLVSPLFDFLSGDMETLDGLCIPKKHFFRHLLRVVIPYSSATGFTMYGKDYVVGALSRLNNGMRYLHANTRKDCAKALSRFPSRDVYDNNLAQAIEIVHSADSAMALLEGCDLKPEPPAQPQRKDGVGIGVIEAPRGTLYYNLDVEDGRIFEANLVIPTAQNQVRMEKDLAAVAQKGIDGGKARGQIVHDLEVLIRAYDPCMSCATHFLRVKWK